MRSAVPLGVHLVAMMGLDDLDVVASRECACGLLDELEDHIDAHAHVRGEHHAHPLRERTDARLLRGVEAGGAHHRPYACLRAGLQVGHRALRPREVDEHLRVSQRLVQVARDAHAAGQAGEGGRIAPDGRAAGDVERAGQHEVVGGQHRLHQHAPHAAAGSGDRHAQSTVRCRQVHGRSRGG
jgi:hypothetical protein